MITVQTFNTIFFFFENFFLVQTDVTNKEATIRLFLIFLFRLILRAKVYSKTYLDKLKIRKTIF
jgi:hypothetical protein